MIEQCRNCLDSVSEMCPLEGLPNPRIRSQFFETEIGRLFEEFENSEILGSMIWPMICKVENSRLSDTQKQGRINRIASTIFAELSFRYVRNHMNRLGMEVLSPKLTKKIFQLAGKTNIITPDGLVVKKDGETEEPKIVGVCEYTMARKPAYNADKKAQKKAYKTGTFLKFFNSMSDQKNQEVQHAIWRETGESERLSFASKDYWGTVLAVTKDPSTERSLDKLGLTGFEHHIPIYRAGLEGYVEHLFRVFRQPIYV